MLKMIRKILIIFKNVYFKVKYFYYKKKITKKYLKGEGAEIGAGNQPFSNNKNIIYFDKYISDKSPKNSIKSDAESIRANNEQFDFLISCHCLEHCPNTIKVLNEWSRILKNRGKLILILPHGKKTFDKGRELHNLKHHLNDFQKKIDYADNTHLDEFINITLKNCKDKWINSAPRLNGKIDQNWLINEGLVHYHVWTEVEMSEILKYSGFNLLEVSNTIPGRDDSFLIIGEKNN